MATYVIGDIQGCYREFLTLLDKIHFSDTDSLWLVGDLINRGPQSLEVLRFLKNFQGNLVCVLGNHDLHLLAVVAGVRSLKPSDTFNDILVASDRDELLFWLRQHPLIHYSNVLNTVMVHAGIYPTWPLTQALDHGLELHNILKGNDYLDFFQHMYGNEPSCWDDMLSGWRRYRFFINVFTRMRTLGSRNHLNFDFDGGAEEMPPDNLPWFKKLLPEYKNIKIVFGHWAALRGETDTPNVYALDTGCVWGNTLTAMRLEDEQRFSVNAIKN